MIISSSITIGQITFVLRVAIQILAYVGLGLISIILLASVTRVAPIDTHDTINRIVGASTATSSTLRWVFGRLRHSHSDPQPSTRFLILLLLSLLYTIFVSLSDIGFLGFYACQVPSSDIFDSPASVTRQDAAVQLVGQNTVNGTDPSNVRAYRCNSATVVQVADEIFESVCSDWHNSTYADNDFFNSNSTDSDAMMPRQLTHYPGRRVDVNSFYLGPNAQRLTLPTIQRGLAVQPHDTGVRMVMGVPQLGTDRKVNIPNTLAVEVDVGCMSLGVRDIGLISGTSVKKMGLVTNGTWRKYTGPDYMEDALSKTVDDVRSYLQPFFDPSTMDSNGIIYSTNSSNLILSTAANVDAYQLPTMSFGAGPEKQFIGNCTEALRNKLGITFDPRIIRPSDVGNMCGFLGVGGSLAVQGIKGMVVNRMVCAAATQVNLVNATIEANAGNEIAVDLTRLPSDLNIVHADYWEEIPSDNGTNFMQFIPYQRYTLSPNPSSPTSHFIHHRNALSVSDNSVGPGSAGNAISSIGHHILGIDSSKGAEFVGLTLLDDGLQRPDFNASEVARWVGEVGGSYFLSSLGYNGWAALQASSMRVISTGGKVGTCYRPYYAIGFVPLVVAAVALVIWMLVSFFSGSWFGTKIVETGYGGVAPFTTVACPGAPPKSTLLAWEASPEPRLQVVQKGYPVTGDANTTALKYLKSTPSYS